MIAGFSCHIEEHNSFLPLVSERAFGSVGKAVGLGIFLYGYIVK